MERKMAFLVGICILLVCFTGCAKTPAALSSTPQIVINTPVSTSLSITGTNSFTDPSGQYHVAGEITNSGSRGVTSVQLSIQITDASGASLLRDAGNKPVDSLTFAPLIDTIAAGQSAPFLYTLATTHGIPAAYQLHISASQPVQASPASLKSENLQIVNDGLYYYLTGELVNPGSQWVAIQGLAGGVRSAQNFVLSAGRSSIYAGELAPSGDPAKRDRTPFVIVFPMPDVDVAQTALWLDAEVLAKPNDDAFVFSLTNAYTDEYNNYHIVGSLTNNTSQSLDTTALVGLYTQAGKVLDADSTPVAFAVDPGQSVPFDLSSFAAINRVSGQAALISGYSAQIDPAETFAPVQPTVSLSSPDAKFQNDFGTLTVTGNFTNSSGKNLSTVTALAVVRDASGRLIATNAISLNPPSGNVFSPNAQGSYKFYVYLDPNADTTGYSYSLLLQGMIAP